MLIYVEFLKKFITFASSISVLPQARNNQRLCNHAPNRLHRLCPNNLITFINLISHR